MMLTIGILVVYAIYAGAILYGITLPRGQRFPAIIALCLTANAFPLQSISVNKDGNSVAGMLSKIVAQYFHLQVHVAARVVVPVLPLLLGILGGLVVVIILWAKNVPAQRGEQSRDRERDPKRRTLDDNSP
jgi:hypothetical protein